MLNRTKARPGRAVKQEQEQNSRNHVQAFLLVSVVLLEDNGPQKYVYQVSVSTLPSIALGTRMEGCICERGNHINLESKILEDSIAGSKLLIHFYSRYLRRKRNRTEKGGGAAGAALTSSSITHPPSQQIVRCDNSHSLRLMTDDGATAPEHMLHVSCGRSPSV